MKSEKRLTSLLFLIFSLFHSVRFLSGGIRLPFWNAVICFKIGLVEEVMISEGIWSLLQNF